MDDHQTSLARSDSLRADLLDFDCSDIGRFEDMPPEELDCLFEQQIAESCTGPPFGSHDLPSPDALPSSSFSSGDTDPQLTPSSTTCDLISDGGNFGESPVDFVTDYANSPIAGFERISPYSSRSSDYSQISQSIPRSFNAASSSMQPSRESSGGPLTEMSQQQWLSFDTSTSDSGDYVEVPLYLGSNLPTVVSANASAPGGPAAFTLTDRTAQQSQAWASANLQSRTYGHSWGTMHEQPQFSQQRSSTQYAIQGSQTYSPFQPQPSQTAEFLSTFTDFRNEQSGSQLSMPPLQSNHEIPHRTAPGLEIPIRSRQTTRANLAHSTRLRFPDHPAIVAEQQSPTSARRTQRPIAVANPEDIPASARPHGSQDSRPKQGGRKRNSHLNQDARDRSSRMRKKGACWRCKLQRDPVSLCKSQTISL